MIRSIYETSVTAAQCDFGKRVDPSTKRLSGPGTRSKNPGRYDFQKPG